MSLGDGGAPPGFTDKCPFETYVPPDLPQLPKTPCQQRFEAEQEGVPVIDDPADAELPLPFPLDLILPTSPIDLIPFVKPLRKGAKGVEGIIDRIVEGVKKGKAKAKKRSRQRGLRRSQRKGKRAERRAGVPKRKRGLRIPGKSKKNGQPYYRFPDEIDDRSAELIEVKGGKSPLDQARDIQQIKDYVQATESGAYRGYQVVIITKRKLGSELLRLKKLGKDRRETEALTNRT